MCFIASCIKVSRCDSPKLQKWILELQQLDINFVKEESVRANMADMLTFKEINVKKDTKKVVEKRIVPTTTMHEELQNVEGTLFFDGAFKRSVGKRQWTLFLWIRWCGSLVW